MTGPAVIGAVALDRFGEDFAETYSRFPGTFIECHQGYEFIRPAFISLAIPCSMADVIWKATRRVLATLKALTQAEMAADPAGYISRLGYRSEDAEWLLKIAMTGDIAPAALFARADFVLGREGPRLVEMNVGPTIGGLGILDRWGERFRNSAAALMGEAAARPIVPRTPVDAWAQALRDVAGRRAPRVALVIADEEADAPHPHEAAHFLTRTGMNAQVMTTDEVRIDGAETSIVTGEPVDLVYGCFTFDQYAAAGYRRFAEEALAAQGLGGAPYLVHPLATLLGNKAALAEPSIMADPAVAPTFHATQRLLDTAAEERERWVLKPALGHGGQEVTIGARCAPSEWRAALRRAGDSNQGWVLQEHVPAQRIEVPAASGVGQYEIGIGCISFAGRFAGLLVRHVPTEIGGPVNVTAGATFGGACILPDEEISAWTGGR